MMATDEFLDDAISTWFVETAPRRLPERVLDATFERTRTNRQLADWRARLATFHLAGPAFALGVAAVVVTAIALTLSLTANQARVGREPGPALPTTPDAWSRVPIHAGPDARGVISLATSPNGLLAVVSVDDDGPSLLFASTDGHRWTRVPPDRLPSPVTGPMGVVDPQEGARVLGTDRGFLLVGGGLWASDDGYDWRRLATPTDDSDLQQGRVLAAALGGPGYVAVGTDNKAWYSTDGSHWSLADVPPPPAELFERQGFARPIVNMIGIAALGDHLVAWGSASRHTADAGMSTSVMWSSTDGLTWTDVLDPRDVDEVPAVAAGPGGFVAIEYSQDASGQNDVAVLLSADGDAWERVDVLGPWWTRDPDETSVQLVVSSVAASNAGFLAAGGHDPVCLFDPCKKGDVVIWASEDGRAWSELPIDDRFAGASVVEGGTWGSHFVLGGSYDGKPAIWITDSAPAAGPGEAVTPPVESSPSAVPTRTPGDATPAAIPAGAFAGLWESTDSDRSRQALDVTQRPDGAYDLTYRDEGATVCSGASSTMTGLAEHTSPGVIVIEQPEFVCDDGTEPMPVSGPVPFEKQLRDFTYIYDVQKDAVSDQLGITWTRVEIAP